MLCGIAVALLAVLPLDVLLVQAASAGWTRVGQLLFRPLVGTLLANTALITVTATAAASALGVGVAWCVERTDLPGRRIWGVLAGLPITVPAFVTSYSWVSLTPVVQDFGGALLIVTLAYYPLVYLPVAAVMRGMDPALEESARSLGLGPGLFRGGSAILQLGPLIIAAATSVGLAAGAAVLTVALALPVAVLVVRYPSRLATVLERSMYLPYALPGITVALALVVLSVRYLRPVYQTAPPLLVAYAMLFLPLALVAVRAALAQAPPAVEEIARSLGCGSWATLRRVTLPLIAPGLGIGAALVFLFTMTELPATLLLAPIGTETLAAHVWSNVRSLAFGAAAPYAAVMIALSAPPTYLLTRKLALLGDTHLG